MNILLRIIKFIFGKSSLELGIDCINCVNGLSDVEICEDCNDGNLYVEKRWKYE